MNIFFLDKDPHIAAMYHCDKHVVKMIVESAQMLSTAHRVLGHDGFCKSHKLYRATHANHPCSKWVRESSANYYWLHSLFEGLLHEYNVRYGRAGKNHASARLHIPLLYLPDGLRSDAAPGVDWDSVPLCVADDCKVPGDPILSYRKYYLHHKWHFAKWKNGSKPFWWIER